MINRQQKEASMTLTLSPGLPVWELLRTAPPTVPVTAYGSRWSIRTWMIRFSLVRAGIMSTYIDVDRETSGLPTATEHSPCVYVDGEWLKAPRIHELQEALVRHGLISDGREETMRR